MGCDIHLYAEKKVKSLFGIGKVKWVTVDKWSKNEDYGKWEGESEYEVKREDKIYTKGRNYNLFCALCGVRSDNFTGSPPMVSEPKGMSNHCPEIIAEIERYGSDGHSHSWNTLKELVEFDWSPYGTTCDYFKNEVIPKLNVLVKNPEDIRIVYFFDK